MDVHVKRGVLIETDAATKIYLMQQGKDYIKEVNDAAVFVIESSTEGSEDRIAEIKELVIKFKNKYSYEKPTKT